MLPDSMPAVNPWTQQGVIDRQGRGQGRRGCYLLRL